MSRAGGQPIATAYAEVGFRDAGLDAGISRLTGKLSAFAGAIPQLLGGAAVIGTFTFLSSQVLGVVNALDELRDRANETRTPIEQLSRLEFAGKLSGIDDVTGMLRFLQKNLAEAADGNKELSATFSRLGVDAGAFVSSGRPAIELMADLVDRLTSMPRASGIRDAMQIFGRGGGEVFKFESGAGLRQGMSAADAAGATVTKESADSADAFNDALVTLGAQLDKIRRDIIVPMLPQIQSLVESGGRIAARPEVGGYLKWAAEGYTELFDALATSSAATLLMGPAGIVANTGVGPNGVRQPGAAGSAARPFVPQWTQMGPAFVPPGASEADRRELIRANRESAQYNADVSNERLADAISALSDRRDEMNELGRMTMPTMTSVGSFWSTAQNAIATDYQREQLRVLQESSDRLERLVEIAGEQANIMNERLAGTPTLAP